MTAMQVISRTLLAMKMAPVNAAMREPGISMAAPMGIRNQSANARMKIPIPHLKRQPMAGAGWACMSGAVMAGSF
ncbi:hypothetical protein D3C86_2066400 [compost metagenome]